MAGSRAGLRSRNARGLPVADRDARWTFRHGFLDARRRRDLARGVRRRTRVECTAESLRTARRKALAPESHRRLHRENVDHLQTDHWGSCERQFNVRVKRSPLNLLLSSRGGAGQAVWALNACEIEPLLDWAAGRSFRFGPECSADPATTCRISAHDSAWDATRGSGFDAPVSEILRQNGTEVTRRMIYSSSRAGSRWISRPASIA